MLFLGGEFSHWRNKKHNSVQIVQEHPLVDDHQSIIYLTKLEKKKKKP
jgi:hypothetical protein